MSMDDEIAELRSTIVKLEGDLAWQQERYETTSKLVNDLALCVGDAIVGLHNLASEVSKRVITIAETLPR